MIPTVLLWGLMFGRWWRVALITSAVAWPAILLVDGSVGWEPALLGGAALAVANAAFGVAVHQGVVRLVRWLRREPSPVPH